MASANPTPPMIPEPSSARLSIESWAIDEPALAALLQSGLPPAQASARFGLQLLKQDKFEDAATVFRAAIALSPGDPDLWTNLGVALDRSNAPAEAAAALEQSIARLMHQPDLWIYLGVIRGKLGDEAGAEAAYRTALAQDSASAAAWQCLGLLKEAQRDYPAAIDCLRACIQLGQGSAAISANLGKLSYQLGRVQEAQAAYADAVRAAPENPHYQRMLSKARFLSEAIAGAPIDQSLADYRPKAASGEGAPSADDDAKERLAWLEIAAGLLTGLGHREAAIRLLKKQVELAPESASARYLLDAASGQALQGAPRDYIVESFDAFAERFDAQLVGVLGYDVPEQLCAAISAVARKSTVGDKPPGERLDALDAGCGTGLCGPLLRPLCVKLVGVDLSPKMLAQAGRRALYDELVCSDLVDFLAARADAPFDLIVAADVLLYFGALEALFASAARALRPDGLFAFSTELPEGTGAPGYRVLPSGRFAHEPGYVKGVAQAAFALESCIETTLRLDAKSRVRGNLFLFRRRVG